MKKYFWGIHVTLVIAGLTFPLKVVARDVIEDEFYAIMQFVDSPQRSSVMRHAYSAEAMPLPGEKGPVDVLLRRTRTLLTEFNADGQFQHLSNQLSKLSALSGTVPYSDEGERLDLFRQVEHVSRKVAFSNPLLKFNDLVFLKRHNSSFNHMCDQYFGKNQVEGGGIYILENAFSDAPVLRDVLADSILENGRRIGQKLDGGSFLSPSLSYDGKTIYFSHTWIKRNSLDDQDAAYHIYKVNVAYLEQISGESEWVNQAPFVNADEDQVIVLPDNTVSLAATATDEGLPNSTLDVAWQLGEGPAAVQFSDADRSDSIAQFSGAGDYYLECVANDGDLATTNTILVLVLDTVDPDDTDLDRMSDTWENHYFKGTDKPKGAADEDWDNDGMSNRMEYIAGSDPTDGVGYHINISSADGNVIAEFSAPAAASTMAAGIRYFTLQRADPSTLPLQWINVPGYTDITGADQLVQWQDTSDQAGLFRVVVRLEAR